MTLPSILERAGFDTRLRFLYDRLHALPILGPGLGWLVSCVYPRGSKVWVIVQSGLAKGLWMHLDPRYEAEYSTGKYESAIQDVLAEHLHRGDTFYEVGAHIGFLTLGAAQLVGPEGEVVAFEADPENAARIEDHLRRNSLAQAQVLPKAIWSDARRLHFERASPLSSRNTGAVRADSTVVRSSEVIEVEAVALDDYVRGRRPPSLIKIDVEGAELCVLVGAERLLSERKPFVLCEVHAADIAVQVQDWLSKMDYALDWFADETEFPRHLIARPSRDDDSS